MGNGTLKDVLYSHFHRQGSALSLGGILLLVLWGISACNSTPLSPTASPSPMQTLASATPLPTPQPSANSFNEATQVNLLIQKSEIQQGKVYDGNGQLLEDVNIQIRSLHPSAPYQVETKASRGEYSFDKAPMGVSLEFKAEKQGYASRKKVELISWYPSSNVRKFDFGTEFPLLWSNGSAFYFRLNDQPEVIQVTPSRNGSGVSPKTDFTLHFSEPMDRQSVEDNFTIRSFNSRLFTVDGGPLPYGHIDAPIPHTVKGNGIIASNYQTGQGTPIYDSSAFDISWNAENTQVTFSFKDGKVLPTDRNKDSVPDYNIAFKSFKTENRTIRDKKGIERQEKHFKLTDGDFEESYKFSILPDFIPPILESAQWTGAKLQTPAFSLKFSEPMILKTHSLNFAGGMKDNPASCKQAPAGYPEAKSCIPQRAGQNYAVKITAANGIPRFEGAWSQLGGKADYDSQDPALKTVTLSLAPYLGPNRTHYYAADQILLTDSGRYHTGNFQDNFSFLLDKIDGTQTKVEVSLSANLNTGESLSQDLMVKLNQKLGEMGSTARFTSTFIIDPGYPPGLNAPGRISLKLLDAQSDHLGFSALPTPAANSSDDALPNFQVGGRSLQTGKFLFEFQAGDQLEIKAATSILDPAGNAMEPSYIKVLFMPNQGNL